MLEVSDLVVRYGAATALDGVSLRVERGEMVALIGPNGAGKSTLLNTICGVLRPASGMYRLAGRVAQVPEGRQLFAGMTVDDNLRLGAWSIRERDPKRVYALFPQLVALSRRVAGTLSGGEQQMLAIGRALMARPRLLLLDEPSMGIAPILVQRIYETIGEINRSGVAILLVEQNANYALDISTRGYVLETGRVVLSGASSSLRVDPEVQKAYLGA